MLPLVAFFIFGSPFLDPSGSSSGHVNSAIIGVQELLKNPLGRGLGTAGQLSLYHSNIAASNTGESYLAALTFQTGFPGVFLYFLFFTLLAYYLFIIWRSSVKNSYLKDYKNLALIGLTFAIGIPLTSIFANSAISPIPVSLPLIFCGLLISIFWVHQYSPS